MQAQFGGLGRWEPENRNRSCEQSNAASSIAGCRAMHVKNNFGPAARPAPSCPGAESWYQLRPALRRVHPFGPLARRRPGLSLLKGPGGPEVGPRAGDPYDLLVEQGDTHRCRGLRWRRRFRREQVKTGEAGRAVARLTPIHFPVTFGVESHLQYPVPGIMTFAASGTNEIPAQG